MAALMFGRCPHNKTRKRKKEGNDGKFSDNAGQDREADKVGYGGGFLAARLPIYCGVNRRCKSDV